MAPTPDEMMVAVTGSLPAQYAGPKAALRPVYEQNA